MHTIGWHYEASRHRLDALLRPLDDDAWLLPVAACPGWRVRDVLAHLVGNTEDGAAGRIQGGPPDEALTAEQVERHAGETPIELLDLWAITGPFVADAVTESGMWPAAFDVVTHEHDLRAALGSPGVRDDDSITELAGLLADQLAAAAPVVIDLGGRTVGSATGDGPAITWRTTPFELLRTRLGRRSADQVTAMDWDGDPTPVLGVLFVFGPSPLPIAE